MAQPGPPAIYFHPDMMEGEGRDLVGRRSAGTSFVNGFLAHAGVAEICAVVEHRKHADALRQLLEEAGEERPVRTAVLRQGEGFGEFGTVFFPAPGYEAASWRRLRFGAASCSLVGVTHTVSTRRIVESLHRLVSEPVEEWDAIICTSRAVHSVVARQFELETTFFRQRFGATRVPLPRLPVIPLGIRTADFEPRPGARARMRAERSVPDDAIVVMSMGRLSIVEKANPVPLYLALEQVARETGREIRLWEVGWSGRPEEEALFHRGAEELCERVSVSFLDGREPDIRRDVWAAADIFCLPSDSIQETFGLVPVEAMAAGLPVVMPDWNGFRDTVVHGETGFLVPTRMAADTAFGAEIARRHADMRDGYLHYLTFIQSRVQVDIPALAGAFRRLVEDDALRARMGRAGAAHARRRYDWAAVMPHYLRLADDLAAMREGKIPMTRMLSPRFVSPIEADPYELYAEYPTEALSPEAEIRAGTPFTPEALARFDELSARKLYSRHASDRAFVARVAAELDPEVPTTPAAIAARLGRGQEQVNAAVLELAKFDFVRFAPIGPRPADRPLRPG